MAEPDPRIPLRRTGVHAEGSTEIIGERWQLANSDVAEVFAALEFHGRSDTLGASLGRSLYEALSRDPFPAEPPRPQDSIISDPEYGEELAIELAGGAQLRTGADTSDGEAHVRFSGSYVRVVLADGTENGYWHADEWQADPVGVMAAIFGAASGIELRPQSREHEREHDPDDPAYGGDPNYGNRLD